MRLLFAIFGLIFGAHASANYPQVEIKTTLGPILIELYPDKAPKTVENFLTYVKTNFYKGTIFHRVVNNFVIQGRNFRNISFSILLHQIKIHDNLMKQLYPSF